MKEIDLLPEWYKSGKRRRSSYHTQYIVLAGVFTAMVAWNFSATHSVSKATAQLARAESSRAEAEHDAQQFAGLKSKVTQLQKKASQLDQLKSKINIANVLAEISFLIDEKVVLSKAEFVAENFLGEQKNRTSGGSIVRAVRTNAELSTPGRGFGHVRFKVVISGVASDAADVADLICRLEDSPYFCEVIPLFSRNRKITGATTIGPKNHQVSEFEIECYLANYRQGHCVAKDVQNTNRQR